MRIIVGGGGPAGLTAAWELAHHSLNPVLLEALPQVGGLARTEEYKGYRFDLGGHRFFSKSAELEALWEKMLGEPLMVRQRLSRIYYRNRFFRYPLKPLDAFFKLGPVASFAALASYFWAQVFPRRPEKSFEDWVSNRFGWRLYKTFFKTYTEKVWGVPCEEISADWAAQRIKGLSLSTAVLKALGLQRGTVKTLIEEFKYPPLGPGQLWEATAQQAEAHGARVLTRHRITKLLREGERLVGVRVETPEGTEEFPLDEFFSSLPLREVVLNLDPPAPKEVREAAEGLRYRDFLTVALMIDRPHLFEDNWIYVHSPEVRVGRLQNYRNWSPYLVPDEGKNCIGMEYFCWESEEFYNRPNDRLIELAADELAKLKLVKPDWVFDGTVVRVQKAYPVYDLGYKERLQVIREYLDKFGNLHCIGRNGQHRYNNMDHSMMTALLAVRNVALGEHNDPWRVNVDAEYHEEASS